MIATPSESHGRPPGHRLRGDVLPVHGPIGQAVRSAHVLDHADNATAFEDGWYRTGDLVEVSEGRLTVVGRLKEVVNRNGLKISLAEIDGAISGMPGSATGSRVRPPSAGTSSGMVRFAHRCLTATPS